MKQMKRDETAISVILYTQQGRMKGRSRSGQCHLDNDIGQKDTGD